MRNTSMTRIKDGKQHTRHVNVNVNVNVDAMMFRIHPIQPTNSPKMFAGLFCPGQFVDTKARKERQRCAKKQACIACCAGHSSQVQVIVVHPLLPLQYLDSFRHACQINSGCVSTFPIIVCCISTLVPWLL